MHSAETELSVPSQLSEVSYRLQLPLWWLGWVASLSKVHFHLRLKLQEESGPSDKQE